MKKEFKEYKEEPGDAGSRRGGEQSYPGPGSPMVDPPVASIAYLGKKAPQLRHIPVATPPDSWILAPPPCTP